MAEAARALQAAGSDGRALLALLGDCWRACEREPMGRERKALLDHLATARRPGTSAMQLRKRIAEAQRCLAQQATSDRWPPAAAYLSSLAQASHVFLADQ